MVRHVVGGGGARGGRPDATTGAAAGEGRRGTTAAARAESSRRRRAPPHPGLSPEGRGGRLLSPEGEGVRRLRARLGDAPRGRHDAAVVARGELGPAAQRELLEDVREVRLHGRLGDPEPLGGLQVAEPAHDEVHDLLLPGAQSLPEGQLAHRGLDRAGRQLLDGQGDHPLAGPHLALVHDADRLDQALDRGALGEDPAGARLEGLDGPPLIPVGAGQDHPGAHPVQAKLAADLEGAVGLRVHEENVGNAAAQQVPNRGRGQLGHHLEATDRSPAADAGRTGTGSYH